jgi:hypothetical protein
MKREGRPVQRASERAISKYSEGYNTLRNAQYPIFMKNRLARSKKILAFLLENR